MAIRFASVKRYGGEGAESLLAFYWQLLRSATHGMCAVKSTSFTKASVFPLTQTCFDLSLHTLLFTLPFIITISWHWGYCGSNASSRTSASPNDDVEYATSENFP